MTNPLIPWRDADGWNQVQYYSTIHAADINGNSNAEVIARDAYGLQTWGFDQISNTWKQLSAENPAWSDTSGWGQPQYYSTIQLADINGDGRAELMARDAYGLQTWSFDLISNTWKQLSVNNPAWSDTSGWGQPQYYSTIQLADINGDGRAELMARDAYGLQTWSFDQTSNTWKQLSANNPAWSDTSGWGQPQYYSTIQLADINGDGRAELMARDAYGLQTWSFDQTSNTWKQLSANNPVWSDASGWGQPQYYSTIRLADINNDGQAELVARDAYGLQTWSFDQTSNTWKQLSANNPAWSDASGWGQPQYYSTIHLADFKGYRKAELVARDAYGIQLWEFDTISNQWQQLSANNPAWSDAGGWGQPQYYSTILAADVVGYGSAELMARSANGLESWSLHLKWVWDEIVSGN